MKSKRDVRNWKKNRAGSISVYFRLTTASTFSVFYSVWDEFIWVSSCINLKIPSVGPLISNSVVLDIFVDLFKHTMNSQGSAGPPRPCSDLQQHHQWTQVHEAAPNTSTHPCPRPAQPQVWLCSELAFVSFCKGENGHFSVEPVPQSSKVLSHLLAQAKGQHLKAAVRCPGPTLTGTVTRGNVYKN